MMFSDQNELSEQERAAIAALPRELAPGDLLEERVVRALRQQGHFGAAVHASRSWPRVALRAAAAVLLFAGGVATGRYMLTQTPAAAQSAIKRASVQPPPRKIDDGAQQVKRNETVVAQREMWL
ncbi:MAG: hypothetical protein ABIQ55_00710 [Gemmatimonadaceae bacterium]